jgi:hypothetical protein
MEKECKKKKNVSIFFLRNSVWKKIKDVFIAICEEERFFRSETSSVQFENHLSAYPHTQLSLFRNNTQCTVFNIHEKNDKTITRKIIINFD